MLERRVEEASLNSWPAIQQVLFDGWIVRSSGGYTKRANSVTPIYPSSLSPEEKIVACENFYRTRQQPTIFRLPSFLSTSHELDAILAQRGYQHIDHVLILSTELISHSSNFDLHNVPYATWLALVCHFKQSSLEQNELHHAIIKRIVPDTLFAVLYNEEQPVACGLGVLENEMFGLFDIITDPTQRNKGYGRQLVTSMLAWACQKGAHHAYLQVVRTNEIAYHLYMKFGFQELYHYWYRIRAL